MKAWLLLLLLQCAARQGSLTGQGDDLLVFLYSDQSQRAAGNSKSRYRRLCTV